MQSKIRSVEDLTPETLIEGGEHRLTLQARLKSTADRGRFQPAGFPEIGHVIYDSPAEDNQTVKVCIVDSAASMANHLETVCLSGPFGADLHEDLQGLPYVRCVTDGDNEGETRVVVTTLSEGHRLASSIFTDKKSWVPALCGEAGNDAARQAARQKANLGRILLKDEFRLVNLAKKTHPLPADWWNVFRGIVKYDPNSLVHGILFPAWGIKIPRMLTAQLDAFGASRVSTSGVKFDKLNMTTSGQPIFSKDEETAREIRATFVLDLALARSFGRADMGLTGKQKEFLVAFALWKITRLLEHPFRYRTDCDLELVGLSVNGGEHQTALPKVDIKKRINEAALDFGRGNDVVTTVYWPKDEIFKKAREGETTDNATDSDQADTEEGVADPGLFGEE